MTGGTSLTSSTPEALWNAPALRTLRPAALSCEGVTRGRLLDRLDLTVPVGMRLLLVSEPEASAPVLLKILAGLTRPSRGRITMAGMDDPSAEGWGRRVAYVGPRTGIRPWMTPREALDLAAALLELPRVDAERRMQRALAWVRIDDTTASRPLRRGGPALLQRTGLAAALIADPEVLLLDDPLRGVEAVERTRMLRLPGGRRTLLLASPHPTREAGLVTHVALLRAGRVARIASVEELAAAGLPLSAAGISALGSHLRQDPKPATPASTVAGGR